MSDEHLFVSRFLKWFIQIFGETCSPDKAVLKMDASQKEYIVKLHNRMRNKIAMGEIKKYNPAAKMPSLVSI